ncbi:MAG TPA: hypothetical protein VNZ26_20640 [Vicinamibacterales bacterium]|jgi:hypothetical protein|nr:hypothetical protein [Vicinamibacterales bacterium]
MPSEFSKAFALSDNPFSPVRKLAGLVRLAAQDGLERRPLMLNAESALIPLFSENAGPFGKHLQTFRRRLKQHGYSDNPPSVGVQSHVFTIYGIEGTGKTTLAQAMIRWLKRCKPDAGNWHVRDELSWRKGRLAAQEIADIEGEYQYIKSDSQPNTYCCIVLDNLVQEMEQRAFELYDELARDRVVFLFLLSNDDRLVPSFSGKGKQQVEPFWMPPLSADSAVAFVKERVSRFRTDPQSSPPWLGQHALFPFAEDDIRSAFSSGSILTRVGANTVAIRDFAVMANRMLAKRLEALDDDFDIARQQTMDVSHFVSLSDGYKDLVAA